VLSRGLAPVALGAALGIALALGHGRVLRGVLFGISPHDPATLAVVLGTIALAATAACLLPARQATRMDPAEVLRGQ
jgi:ABC-type antimicrobial peptide transport system permease subunit